MATIYSAPLGFSVSLTNSDVNWQCSLSWNSVSGANGYVVLRRRLINGTFKGVSSYSGKLATTSFVDTNVVRGESYVYAVRALFADGVGRVTGISQVIAIPTQDPPGTGGGGGGGGTPPPPLPPGGINAPVNLTVTPGYNNSTNQPFMDISWQLRSGVAGIKVYHLDASAITPIATLAAGITTYRVEGANFVGFSAYGVSFVDGSGIESLCSAPVWGYGGYDPDFSPGWLPSVANVPYGVNVETEYNNAAGRNVVRWTAATKDFLHLYNIYRSVNGGAYSLVANGIMTQVYYDENVSAPNTYAYKVSLKRPTWQSGVGLVLVETSQSSASNTITPTTTQPILLVNSGWSGSVISVGHKSAKIGYPPVVGAKAYGAYPTVQSIIEGLKASTGTAVEVNGAANGVAKNYTVVAMDKEPPAMFHEQGGWPGMSQTMVTNGLGDPSNIPNVLASFTINVTPQAFTPSGVQTYFTDSFDGRAFNFGLTEVNVVDSSLAAGQGRPFPLFGDPWVSQYKNGNTDNDWNVYFVDTDRYCTKVFVMAGHIMTVMSDNGGFLTPNIPRHVTNSSLILEPRKTVNLGSTDIIRLAYFVDGHSPSARDWHKVVIRSRADGWWRPNDEFFKKPTNSGKFIFASQFRDKWQVNYGNGTDTPGVGAAFYRTPALNGGMDKLDYRTLVEIFYQRSSRRFVVKEDGIKVVDTIFAADPDLNWTDISFGIVQQFYHSRLEYEDIVYFPANPPDRYVTNTYRRHTRERHWQSFVIERVSAFPA